MMKYALLKDLPESSPFPGFNGKFISSKEMSFVYWKIKEGAILPEHSHMHEQVAHLLEGRLEFSLNGHTQILEAGSITIIPSNAVHSGKALTDCYIMDAFCPVREDYFKYESPQ